MDDQLSPGILDEDIQSRAAARGREPALIESFGIRGLYGYRTISLTSKHAATILIAKNGTGKTTLLGALDAFLRLQFFRLRHLDFEEIFCRLRGSPDEIVVTHDDVVEFLQSPTEGELSKLSSKSGISVSDLFSFITTDYKSAFANYLNDNDHSSPVNVLARSYGYDAQEAERACDSALAALFKRSPKLASVHDAITTALKDYEIVYLPTYRRVELALTEEPTRTEHRRRRPKIKFATGGLHTGDIQFGLSDISERLSELNQDIILRSNRGYRELSENIINELISGFEVSDEVDIPKPEELRLFFSRLESGSRYIGPYYAVSAPDLEKIYSGDGVPAESRKFLTYFLSKLSAVIRITKDIEQPVEKFVFSCNKYLSSSDLSTSLTGGAAHKRLPSIDAKILRMDRTDLSVWVESLPGERRISLDALSSGEKQMISLFAKLYLYPKRKIVLIDEPELSLSIDWQRGILVDVMLSPECEQVVAITHSPFVFDNALEPFAKSLRVHVDELQPKLGFDGQGEPLQ